MPEVEEIQYLTTSLIHSDGSFCADTCPYYPTSHPMFMNKCRLFGMLQKENEKYIRHLVCNTTKSNCKIKIMSKEEIADKVIYNFDDIQAEYFKKLHDMFETDYEYKIAEEIYYEKQHKYLREVKGMNI